MKPSRREQPTEVVEAGDLRKYRTELPNLIDDLSLSVFAYRLYGHLKRRAGAGSDGFVTEGLRSLAAHCSMAKNTAMKARQELLDKGLISTEEIVNDRGRFERITIVDIWAENFARYAEMRARKSQHLIGRDVSPRETPGVASGETGVSHGESGGVSRGETPGVASGETQRKNLGEGTFEKEPSPSARSAPPAPPSAGGGGEPRSRFTRKERLAYYQNKPGVKEPEALANAAFVRRGEADEEIAEWYAADKPVGKEPPRDTSACPDCRGTNRVEPGGPGKGVAKCRHPRLAPAEAATGAVPARASP